MPIRASVSSVIPPNQPAGSGLLTMEQVRNEFNALRRALRTPQKVEEFTVEDTAGNVIFWVGSRVVGARPYKGFWTYEGYLGGDNPTNAPVSVVDGVVSITLGGTDDAAALEVKDGAGDVVAWIGKDGTDYGIWAANIWIGGTGPDDAPFQSDGEETVIGKNGFIVLKNEDEEEVGWIGTRTLGPVGLEEEYAGAYFNQLYIGGDDATEAPFYSDGTETVIGKNGYIVFKNADDEEVGWIGTRTISTVDYAGGWVKEWRVGGADTENAVIVADEDGDVTIDGATLTLTKNGITTTIGNDLSASGLGFDGLSIFDSDGTGIEILKDNIYFLFEGGVTTRIEVQETGGLITVHGTSGAGLYSAEILSLKSNRLVLNASSSDLFSYFGTTFVDSSLNGYFTNIYTKTEVDALIAAIDTSNFYTKSEVDTLLAGKANSSHSHNSMTILTTAGGGVAAHTHTGAVT